MGFVPTDSKENLDWYKQLVNRNEKLMKAHKVKSNIFTWIFVR